MSSPGPRHSRSERFLHNIGLGPGRGHSLCDYTLTVSFAISKMCSLRLLSPIQLAVDTVRAHISETMNLSLGGGGWMYHDEQHTEVAR